MTSSAGASSTQVIYVTDEADSLLYLLHMTMLRQITIWICQCLLFLIGIGIAQLCAQFGSELLVSVFNIDETLPKAVIFFGTAALLGFLGNRYWPRGWLSNPLL
jgi:hypothetical protein